MVNLQAVAQNNDLRAAHFILRFCNMSVVEKKILSVRILTGELPVFSIVSSLVFYTTAEKCGAPCTTEQFTCSNGCCLDLGLECDSTPQCSDNSDEEKCEERKS